MGLLSLFSRSAPANPVRLPAGSFTIDPGGRVIASTLPQSFPPNLVREIGQLVLSTFRSAQQANLPLTELIADYSALKLTARELRGGAIVFLAPHGLTPGSAAKSTA